MLCCAPRCAGMHEGAYTAAQERQMGEAVESAAAESNARALEEVEQREVQLSAALAEAHASLGNMRKLHQVRMHARKALRSTVTLYSL